ncbi:MAG: hypothetical protein KF726_09220 [Anaerolineae bacterium]|nr:hypothetical protein [Anaerolineae bacterium]
MLRSSDDVRLDSKVFLEGPAGTGKTTYSIGYLLKLLEQGVSPDRILVLVPQITLGRPYQLAVHESEARGGSLTIQTIAGIARKMVELYWPVIAAPMGFSNPNSEPTFLNIETAQYYMARMALPAIESGVFADISLPPPRIMSQVLDNLNRAALLRFPLDEVMQRLTLAWGDERQSTRPQIYEAAGELATQFRSYCLEHNLLDFSLMIECLNHFITDHPRYATQFVRHYDFLIADNLEEMNQTALDFVQWALPQLRGGLLIFDHEAGYRLFLGATGDNAYDLSRLCEQTKVFSQSLVNAPELKELSDAFRRRLGPIFEPQPANDGSTPEPSQAFSFEFNRYYPQMLHWVADQIIDLVNNKGVPPREIAVLAPYLNDSLRFTLSYELERAGIPTISHRPSRSLRDEPATRTLITLALLAHPDWEMLPAPIDVADALSQSISGLDPVRARLLTSIVYRQNSGELGAFAGINEEMRARLTYLLGERYEVLRSWLMAYRAQTEVQGAEPLDHFLSRLFGEVLSQPGFGFHSNMEAGRIAAQLINSAETFRRTLYPNEEADWLDAGKEYMTILQQRLVSALFVQNWHEENSDAVFLAPAFTFLMRNRVVDYQFWLDVGSSSWSERLEQPLTQPYVLQPDYPREMVWTDEMETDAERDLTYRVVMGLTRRCRKHLYLGISDLGESGFEARGLLLRTFQGILQGSQAGADTSGTQVESEA